MSTVELGTFGAEVILDDSKFNSGLDNVDKKMKKSEGGMKGFGKNMGKLAVGAVAGLTTAIAGAGAAGVAMADKFASTADKIDKTSMKMGLSKEAYQELEFAMGQVGVTSGTFEKSFMRLNQRLANTSDNEKYRKAIQDLGIATEDATGKTRDADSVFMETVQALHEVEDSSQQAALAQEIFGTKTAQELMPAIIAGGDAISDLRGEAHELGAVISDEGVTAGVLWTDTMDKMQNMMQGVFNSLAQELLPIFQTMVDWVIDNMPTIQATFKLVFDTIKNVIGTAITVIGNIITWLKTWFTENQSTLTNIKQGFNDFVQVVKDLINGFVTAATQLWKKYGDDILAFAKTTFNNIKSVISGVLDVIKGIIKTVTGIITGDWDKAWEGIKQILSGVWQAIKGIVNQAINNVKAVINNVWNIIKNVTSSVWNGIKNVISNIATNIWNSVKSRFNSMKNTVSSIFNGIKSVASSIFNKIKDAITSPVSKAVDTVKRLIGKIKDAFNFNWSLPKLKLPSVSVSMKENSWGIPYPDFDVSWHKNGGFFDKPSLIGVGEAGKEAVVPLVGKQMNPFADAVYKRLSNNMNRGNTTTNNTNHNNENKFDIHINVSGNGSNRGVADEVYRSMVQGLRDLGVRFT